MIATVLSLVAAALLEISGDGVIRTGLARASVPLLVAGAALLGLYGFVVNYDRAIDFGRLMGTYIAVFFVVSQLIAVVAFGERPGTRLLIGGALIVAGGIWIQLGVE
jgi:small multidrug resistance family-3 protein